MNRRGFLGSLVAACVAPFVPTPKREPIALCEPYTVSWDLASADEAEFLMACRKHGWHSVGETVDVQLPKRYWVCNRDNPTVGEWID